MNEVIVFGVHAIIVKNRKVLLVRNEDDLFDLPGSVCEFGVNPLELLKKKIKSQTGCTIKNAKLMDISSIVSKGKKTHHIDIVYDVKVNTENLKVEWMCIDELSKSMISVLAYEVLIIKGFVVK